MADNFSKMEKIKNKDYAERIKHMLGGNFIPCILLSGGGIGPAEKKVIKDTANKASSNSLEKYEDIKMDIKLDIIFALLKSRVEALRTCRNNIATQSRTLNSFHGD